MNVFKRFLKYTEGMNGVIFIIYCLFLSIITSIESVNFSIKYFFISFVCTALLSFFGGHKIIRFFSNKCIRYNKALCETENKQKNLIKKITFFIVPFVVFLLCFLAYYPGGYSPDSISQYNQAITNDYNDWHPVIHTLIAFKLPLLLTNNWIGSVVLFQIICFSLVLAYSFTIIYKYSNIKYTIVSMMFILLNPQILNIIMRPWKDVSFAMCALLLTIYSLQIYMSKGEWVKKPLNLALFSFVWTLATLFRHNAILFTIPLMFALFFAISKKRAFVICMSAAVLFVGIKVPLYSFLDVEKPDKRQIETLGLPMTVIGAAVTYSPEKLDEEVLEFAYKVASKEVWEEKYINGSYNYVKWDERTNNNVIEEYGAKNVIFIMFKCIKSSPKVSLTALIKLTEASYTISDRYNSVNIPSIAVNNENIVYKGNTYIKNWLETYSTFIDDNFSHMFMFLGVVHLIVLISVLAKCRLNSKKDWRKILFIIPAIVYNVGTSFLLTGIEDADRFFCYTFILLPELLLFLYVKEND